MQYQVYTEKNRSEFSKTLVGEFTDLEEAFDAALKAVEGDETLRYIIEETNGHFNNYGDLEVRIVAES